MMSGIDVIFAELREMKDKERKEAIVKIIKWALGMGMVEIDA